MPDRPHVAIVLQRLPDQKVRISLYHPESLRLAPTGITAGPDEDSIEREVLRVKNQLEKNGNRTSVREVSR